MWSYQIDEARGLVITTAWGVVTKADILEHRQQLKRDTRFRRSFFQLLDFTRVTSVDIDNKTVNELAREHLFSRKSRRAFVASSLLTYGMARMFISIRHLAGGAEQMEVFKNQHEALFWLFGTGQVTVTTSGRAARAAP